MATVDEVKAALRKLGFKEDAFGHLQITRPNVKKTYRAKFQATSVRFEVRIDKQWFRIASGYFARCLILENGVMVGTLRVTSDWVNAT